MNKMLTGTGLIILLMLISVPMGFGGNPAPNEPPIQIAGPAIVGTITFEMVSVSGSGSGSGILQAKLEATCKGEDFTLTAPMPAGCNNLSCITVEYFEGNNKVDPPIPPHNRLDGIVNYFPSGCSSHLNTIDAMIFNVVKMTDYVSYKIADVVIMFYSYK